MRLGRGVRVLVVSASMGAGHDGAARELAARLDAAGLQVRAVDFLDALPLGLGRLLRWSYRLQLRVVPWTYEAIFRVWYRLTILWRPLVALDTLLAGRRMRGWVAAWQPTVVVSTYPLASLVLGQLRRRGELDQPVVTIVTDFAVHPLWVHPAVDLHLCVHSRPAREAALRGGGRAVACGPLVDRRYLAPPADRVAARRRLDLGPHDRVVLVVACSWGAGKVEATVRCLAGSGRYLPVTVCGRGRRLRRRLQRRGLGVALGWVGDMAALMAAADALVENAGGLTCMEALAAGLPVVTYRPLPGHGRANAAGMAGAGVTVYPTDEAGLLATLDRVTAGGPARERLVRRGRAMFAVDAAAEILDLAALAEAGNPTPHPRPRRVPVRYVAAAAVPVAIFYATLTFGVSAAASLGVGVAHPAARGHDNVYLAVRLSQAQLADPRELALVERLHATAVVDEPGPRNSPDLLRRLTAAQVDVAFADWHGEDLVRWRRSNQRRAAQAPPRDQGRRRTLLPERRIDVVDLVFSRWTHSRIVLPHRVLDGDDWPWRLQPGRVYLVDARQSSLGEFGHLVESIGRELDTEHLTGAPCAVLA